MIACAYRNETVVKLLLELGAHVNEQNRINGNTPLMELFSFTWKINDTYRNIFKLLLEAGANVNIQNYFFKTVLMILLNNTKCAENYAELINQLIPISNLNLRDSGKRTVLYSPFMIRNIDTIKLLIKHNIDVSLCDLDNCTALMHICKNSHVHEYNIPISHMVLLISATIIFNQAELICLCKTADETVFKSYYTKFKYECTEKILLNCMSTHKNKKLLEDSIMNLYYEKITYDQKLLNL